MESRNRQLAVMLAACAGLVAQADHMCKSGSFLAGAADKVVGLQCQNVNRSTCCKFSGDLLDGIGTCGIPWGNQVTPADCEAAGGTPDEVLTCADIMALYLDENVTSCPTNTNNEYNLAGCCEQLACECVGTDDIAGELHSQYRARCEDTDFASFEAMLCERGGQNDIFKTLSCAAMSEDDCGEKIPGLESIPNLGDKIMRDLCPAKCNSCEADLVWAPRLCEHADDDVYQGATDVECAGITEEQCCSLGGEHSGGKCTDVFELCRLGPRKLGQDLVKMCTDAGGFPKVTGTCDQWFNPSSPCQHFTWALKYAAQAGCCVNSMLWCHTNTAEGPVDVPNFCEDPADYNPNGVLKLSCGGLNSSTCCEFGGEFEDVSEWAEGCQKGQTQCHMKRGVGSDVDLEDTCRKAGGSVLVVFQTCAAELSEDIADDFLKHGQFDEDGLCPIQEVISNTCCGSKPTSMCNKLNFCKDPKQMNYGLPLGLMCDNILDADCTAAGAFVSDEKPDCAPEGSTGRCHMRIEKGLTESPRKVCADSGGVIGEVISTCGRPTDEIVRFVSSQAVNLDKLMKYDPATICDNDGMPKLMQTLAEWCCADGIPLCDGSAASVDDATSQSNDDATGDAKDDGQVLYVSDKIIGLDFEKIESNTDLKESLLTKLKSIYATKYGVLEEKLEIVLSAGSVIVTVQFSLDSQEEMEAVAGKADDIKKDKNDFQAALFQGLQEVSGIEDAEGEAGLSLEVGVPTPESAKQARAPTPTNDARLGASYISLTVFTLLITVRSLE